MFDDVFQAVQFAVDDFQAAGGFLADLRGGAGQILLQQLHMDVQGTEGIADLVSEPGQEAGEQELFLLRRQLAHILSEGRCQNPFHAGDGIGKPAGNPAGRSELFWLDWLEFGFYFIHMRNWPVQDAKNQLSQVIELARSEGPQTITRHGRPVVVVTSAEDYKKLRSHKETPLQFFSRFKGFGLDLVRGKDLPRKIEA